jgi:NAD(P)-dependent dehydrogenase (short-subunit alcohol dehydrogenase family)
MTHDKQVALVTGGNRGIGYELVKQLSLKGFKVILASRDREMGNKAVQKLKELDLDVSCVEMDVANYESISQAAVSINDMGGPSAPRTPRQAAESILWLATIGPDGPNGGFFRDGKQIPW